MATSTYFKNGKSKGGDERAPSGPRKNDADGMTIRPSNDKSSAAGTGPMGLRNEGIGSTGMKAGKHR